MKWKYRYFLIYLFLFHSLSIYSRLVSYIFLLGVGFRYKGGHCDSSIFVSM